MYALCTQEGPSYDCGDQSYYTVICAPRGAFVDPNGAWVAQANSYGWKVASSPNLIRSSISGACS
jgi:hypothetical protein